MGSANVKYLLLSLLLLLPLATNLPSQSVQQEVHLREVGTNAIFQRSAFAHGYRHGYEEGYHLGDIDINMGRHARTRVSEFHDASAHYAPEFGPRESFEAGFCQGLKAGYSDGFLGRMFRAVESLRSMARALDQNPAPADPMNVYFDKGVGAGYNYGHSRGRKEFLAIGEADMDSGGCEQFHPSRPEDIPAKSSFCDGFRRGFGLGAADAVVQSPDSALAARK